MTVSETSNAITAGQAADKLGVTIRTLHHWDEIGLASPSARTARGYRLYGASDLARLQRVLIYRELGLSLDEIRGLVNSKTRQPIQLLREQHDQVLKHIERLQARATGLGRMIAAHERGVLLTTEQQAAIFGSDWKPEWIARAQKRWGETPQWSEYAERAAQRSAEDWADITKNSQDVENQLAAAFDSGVLPGSAEANALAELHRTSLCEYFYLSREMQVCLGRMYEADPEFASHYDRLRPGLTAWLRLTIDANAREHGIDPASATWQ
jgi:DNA-binding transcriptional MerR regulator